MRVRYTFTFKSDFTFEEACQTLLSTKIPKNVIVVLAVVYNNPDLILDLHMEELSYGCLLELSPVVKTASYEIL